MEEIFIEYLDSLYFDGYTEQTLTENPEAVFFHYQEFLNQIN
jgi:hypothetical protein